jgi:cytidylate kinase
MSSESSLRGVIAVDGPAGAGKSTVALRLAERLGGVRLDTGAIYRTVALLAHEAGVGWDDGPALARLASDMDLRFVAAEGGQRVVVGERDVSEDIRTPLMSKGASTVSQHAELREALMEVQRGFGAHGLVVAEGRDMGTTVFPDALVKLFLTATPEVRARRRYDELKARGTDVSFDEVLAEQIARDKADTQREVAPLRQAEDAVVVDSTGLDIDRVVDHMVRAVRDARAATRK